MKDPGHSSSSFASFPSIHPTQRWQCAGGEAAPRLPALASPSPRSRSSGGGGARRPLLLQQQVGGPLGDHHRGRARLAAGQRGHHRGVHHPQPAHAAHPQRRVHHGPRVPRRAHAARAHERVRRVARLPQVRLQAGVRLHVRAGEHLPRHHPPEGLLARDLPRQPHALAQRGHILLGRQEARLDLRRVEGVRRGQGHLALALRPAGHQLEGQAARLGPLAGHLRQRGDAVRVLPARGQEPDLQVRLRQPRARLHKGAVVAADAGHGPAAQQRPLGHHRGLHALAVAGEHGVRERHGLRDVEVHVGRRVVPQVLAHRGEVHLAGHALRLQLRPVAHARQLQQVRRPHGASRQQHLAALPQPHRLLHIVLHVLHAHGAAVLDLDPGDVRARLRLQVRPLQGLLEVRHGRVPAAALALLHLEPPKALLRPRPIVEVLREAARQPQLLRRREKHPGQRVLVPRQLHVQHAPPAVVRALHARLARVLAALEVGQHRVGPPPLGARRLPGPVVRLVPAVVEHHVHAAGPAQRLPAAEVDVPVVAAGVLVGEEDPVEGALEQLERARGRLHQQVLVRGAPRLQHQHLVARLRAELVGKHKAGGAAAQDDVVRLVHGHPCLLEGH
mmetsp:Transcript_5556/g.8820  ORF Transcript_5556/g.8820 Transcript_5556/m.8820 type:complete len:617 (-) Transcript_5556:128-1978(-)